MTAYELARYLRAARGEVIPLDGVEEQVLAHLPTDVKVTVTASPRRGLEATLELTERLTRAGYAAVPTCPPAWCATACTSASCSTEPRPRACASCSCWPA